MQEISIEKIILTKQLSSTNCYQNQKQDPLDQYIENIETSNEKQGLVNSNRLLMTNESLNLINSFNLTNLNFSGIAAPI